MEIKLEPFCLLDWPHALLESYFGFGICSHTEK